MEINIIGVIGDFSMDETNALNAEELARIMDKIPKDEEITLNINSGGGSVFEGFGMYNMLKASPNKINAKINGMAFSIASLIALAADNIQMSEVSMFMIHRASGMAMGNTEEMSKQMDVLKSIDDTLVSVYAQRTGIDREAIQELMDKETFFTSGEAKDQGFVDEIINKVDAKMAAAFKLETMKLKNFWNQIMNDGDVPTNAPAATETGSPVAADEEEEIEEEEEETAEGDDDDPFKKKENEEEEEEEETAFVTRAEFNKLVSAISAMSGKMDEAIAAGTDKAATAAVAELKTGLKSSKRIPRQANASIGTDGSKGYVDKYASFRASMKEIDNNTRPEKK